ncbi:chaperonin 60 subunit alpha 2, chloroplastic-like protein, partial [Tanacetum coccineum]
SPPTHALKPGKALPLRRGWRGYFSVVHTSHDLSLTSHILAMIVPSFLPLATTECNDGITIAKAIELSDSIENAGANAYPRAGDDTTTAIWN